MCCDKCCWQCRRQTASGGISGEPTACSNCATRGHLACAQICFWQNSCRALAQAWVTACSSNVFMRRWCCGGWDGLKLPNFRCLCNSVPYSDTRHQLCAFLWQSSPNLCPILLKNIVTVSLCSDTTHGLCCIQRHFIHPGVIRHRVHILLGVAECLNSVISTAAEMLTASNTHGMPMLMLVILWTAVSVIAASTTKYWDLVWLCWETCFIDVFCVRLKLQEDILYARHSGNRFIHRFVAEMPLYV